MFLDDFTIDGETLTCRVESTGEGFVVTVGDRTFPVEPVGEGLFAVSVGGRRLTIAVAHTDGRYAVDVESYVFELRQPSEEVTTGVEDEHAGVKDKAFAPMPGRVVKVLVEPGEAVREKQQLVIVEAMKMENPVVAPAAGTVKAVNCAAGDQVDTETPLVELELTD